MRRVLIPVAVFFFAAVAATGFAQESGNESGDGFVESDAEGVAGEGVGGVELLRSFLERTPAARLTLFRDARDADGNQIGGGEARLWLARPDRFRLEHDPPEELVIVSDGTVLWTYEPDLLQATRRRYDEGASGGGGSGALAMLAGDAPEAHFQLSAAPVPDADGIRWVTATPRTDGGSSGGGSSGGGGWESSTVRAGFGADGELRAMEIRDAFGGRVLLSVLALSREVPPDDVFYFSPPPGTDVVSDDSEQ